MEASSSWPARPRGVAAATSAAAPGEARAAGCAIGSRRSPNCEKAWWAATRPRWPVARPAPPSASWRWQRELGARAVGDAGQTTTATSRPLASAWWRWDAEPPASTRWQAAPMQCVTLSGAPGGPSSWRWRAPDGAWAKRGAEPPRATPASRLRLVQPMRRPPPESALPLASYAYDGELPSGAVTDASRPRGPYA